MTSCSGATLALGILVLDRLLVLFGGLVLPDGARVIVQDALLDEGLGVWAVRDLVVELVLEHVLLELRTGGGATSAMVALQQRKANSAGLGREGSSSIDSPLSDAPGGLALRSSLGGCFLFGGRVSKALRGQCRIGSPGRLTLDELGTIGAVLEVVLKGVSPCLVGANGRDGSLINQLGLLLSSVGHCGGEWVQLVMRSISVEGCCCKLNEDGEERRVNKSQTADVVVLCISSNVQAKVTEWAVDTAARPCFQCPVRSMVPIIT